LSLLGDLSRGGAAKTPSRKKTPRHPQNLQAAFR
jgi:hypothetical protein